MDLQALPNALAGGKVKTVPVPPHAPDSWIDDELKKVTNRIKVMIEGLSA